MMMGFGFLGILLLGGLVLALLIGGVVAVPRQAGDTRWFGGQRQPTARQVLDARFARGEIDREEYDTIRAQIER